MRAASSQSVARHGSALGEESKEHAAHDVVSAMGVEDGENADILSQ